MYIQRFNFFWPVIILAASGIANGEEKAPEVKAPEQKGADGKPESFNYVNPETARLARYVGTWKVSEQHFSGSGETIATATGTEEVAWILDRRAIQRTYTTSTERTAFQAIGILCWNAALKKYDGVWFNNTSALGPTTVTGDWPDKSDTLTMELHAMTRKGKKLKLKVVERHIDKDNRIRTTYSMDGEQVVKRLQVEYQRMTPCPPKLRLLGG